METFTTEKKKKLRTGLSPISRGWVGEECSKLEKKGTFFFYKGNLFGSGKVLLVLPAGDFYRDLCVSSTKVDVNDHHEGNSFSAGVCAWGYI